VNGDGGQHSFLSCQIFRLLLEKVGIGESAVMALVENLQRENLHFLEEAEGYYNLINEYNLTQEELAKKIGKNQSTIANKMRILKLSPEIKKNIFFNKLSERHARSLLRLPDDEIRKKVLEKICKDELTVKENRSTDRKNYRKRAR